MADFSLLQQPNFAQAALSGYQAGAALGKQKQLDSALSGVDLTRPETLMPVLRADPSTGAALITASGKIADATRDASSRQALSDYLTALQPGQEPHQGAVQAIMPGAPPIGASGVPGTPASGDASAVPATPAQAPTDPNAIVVNAPKPAAPAAPPVPDLAAARTALIKSDPENFLKIQDSLATMDKNQRSKLDDATTAFGNVVEAGKDPNGNWLPADQIKGIVQANRSILLQHGVPADQIDGFDGSPASAQQAENQVLGIKGILEQHDKNRNFALDQAKFGEATRHDHADEATSAENAGTSAAHLGIDRAHLTLDQQAAAQKVAGGSGASPVQQRIIPTANGQTIHAYRNPANGKWYDNAAFK